MSESVEMCSLESGSSSLQCYGIILLSAVLPPVSRPQCTPSIPPDRKKEQEQWEQAFRIIGSQSHFHFHSDCLALVTSPVHSVTP